MIISISGHGRAGKDSLAEWMKNHTVLLYTKSTSAYLKTEMFHHMRVLGHEYKDEEECYSDRANHRNIWAEYIDLFNKNDPARLYKRCLAEQQILTGVRRHHEFAAVQALGVVDLYIWVDRPGNPVDVTQGYGPEMCDIILLNDTLEGLFTRAERLCKQLGILLPSCRGCGKALSKANAWMWDGCPCNHPRGINHGIIDSATCSCDECDKEDIIRQTYEEGSRVS